MKRKLRDISLLFIGATLTFGAAVCSNPKLSVVDASSNAAARALAPTPAFATRAGSTTIADVAASTTSAVVNVTAEHTARTPQLPVDPFGGLGGLDQFFGRRGSRAPNIPSKPQKSLGSGVIVDVAKGLIVTNNHVIEHGKNLKITIANGNTLEASVVGADPHTDLALLKVKGKLTGVRALDYANSSKVRLGDVVLAIGNPFGVGQTVTMGIVSATKRADMGLTDYEDFIQTDAAINPGNSGGALVDMNGQLLGINTAILSRSGGNQGVGFAIPSNMVKTIVASLADDGKIDRGWLGVAIQTVNDDLSEALDLPVKRGVLISDVTASSPAQKAGLKRGDVITAIDGHPIQSSSRLRNAVANAEAGTEIGIEIHRGKEIKTLKVRLGKLRAKLAGGTQIERSGVLAGVGLTDLDEATRAQFDISQTVKTGVVVAELTPNSLASRSGLRKGDVIVEVGRRSVRNAEELSNTLRNKQRAVLLVNRQGTTIFLILKGELK